MKAIRYSTATVRVLWQRDFLHLLRNPSRLVGALALPLLSWWLVGWGSATILRFPGVPVDALEFFFPGVVVLVILLSAMTSSLKVIEDHRAGLLQAILAGPSSAGAVALGQCVSSTTIALVAAGVVLALAPWAGFDSSLISWPLVASAVLLASLASAAFGFTMAWWINKARRFRATTLTLLTPLWLVSGAVFPPDPQKPFLALLMGANPLAYAVSAIRHGLYGGRSPGALCAVDSAAGNLAVLAGLSVGLIILAVFVAQKRQP